MGTETKGKEQGINQISEKCKGKNSTQTCFCPKILSNWLLKTQIAKNISNNKNTSKISKHKEKSQQREKKI